MTTAIRPPGRSLVHGGGEFAPPRPGPRSGAGLTGMALRAREQARVGATSIGDVRGRFIEAGPGERSYFDPAILDRTLEAGTGVG